MREYNKIILVYQYHDVTEHNYILILFAESGGQTPRDFGAADLEDSKQNFQLSDVVNILASVTDNCKVICLLLYSASHKSHDCLLISLF